MSDERPAHGGAFTRRKAKVSIGDGPDQRGEVTVETARPVDEDTDRVAHRVELPDGSTTEVDVADTGFAEWFLELQRSTRALRETLGLDAEE